MRRRPGRLPSTATVFAQMTRTTATAIMAWPSPVLNAAFVSLGAWCPAATRVPSAATPRVLPICRNALWVADAAPL